MKPNEESSDSFYNCTSGITKPAPQRPTPQTTIEAILYCVRQRGLTALRDAANIERLRQCDAAAKRQINERIAKLSAGLSHVT
jgi:hypothetical protein